MFPGTSAAVPAGRAWSFCGLFADGGLGRSRQFAVPAPGSGQQPEVAHPTEASRSQILLIAQSSGTEVAAFAQNTIDGRFDAGYLNTRRAARQDENSPQNFRRTPVFRRHFKRQFFVQRLRPSGGAPEVRIQQGGLSPSDAPACWDFCLRMAGNIVVVIVPGPDIGADVFPDPVQFAGALDNVIM